MAENKPSTYMRTNWIAAMTRNLAMIHPELSHDEIETFVIKEFREHYEDHRCYIHNSYEAAVTETTLGRVVDWIEAENPLISESGVFFYQKSQRRNVNVEIIKESMLDKRTQYKKEMFDAMKAGEPFLAAVKKLQQLNSKKAANSGYGAEGQASSFLYNLNSAMSVTAAGRGQLATAICCFENLFEDNVKFWDMDQFYEFIGNVSSEEPLWKFDSGSVIDIIPTKNEWIERLRAKFAHPSLCDIDKVTAVYKSLSDEMRMRTHYKCNIRAFLVNAVPMKLYRLAVSGKEEFTNPNKPPDDVAKYVNRLCDLIVEFVNYKYSQFRYEDRGRYMRRRLVCVNDTDSNLKTLMNIRQFIYEEVLPVTIMRKKAARLHRVKVLNVLASIATAAIKATLWNYLGYVHVPEEDRDYVKMKNEMAYDILIVTHAKKSYIGWLTRQEEVLFKSPKIDVKGVNFFKSTSTEKTTAFIYDELLRGQLFEPKDGKISLPRIYKKMVGFQREITDEISKGDLGYMRRSVKVKSADAYSAPMSIGAYKAVNTWNALVDDKDRIPLPASVTLVKVKLANRKDAAPLAQWPKIYERVMKLFDTDPEYGDRVEYNPKTKKETRIKGKGVKTIAVPEEYDELPEWLLPIIDVETIVNDNIKLLEQLSNSLGFTPMKAAHRGAALKYYANVVRI